MEKQIEEIIDKYKKLIPKLQKKQDFYEATNRSGACIAIQGEIQAYNAVIKDLKEITK